MHSFKVPLLMLATVILLTGCSDPKTAASSAPALRADPVTRYDMANGCYAIRSVASNRFIAQGSTGDYAASATRLSAAEPFFMKPSALGKYLIYARNATFLTANASGVESAIAPSDAVIWVVNTTAQGHFTLRSDIIGQSLASDASGKLLMSEPAAFDFVPTSGCTAYPEMPVDIDGEPYKGQGVDKPVIGFADAHTHMMMSHELSDGSGHVGGSAAGMLYGQMFNRFGVTEALKDCKDAHGPEGVLDGNTIITTTPSLHETKGWPDFAGWPTAHSYTHQTMYYRWVERSWRSGQRLMVGLGTNISALCEAAAVAFGRPGSDCDDTSIGVKQLHYLYDMQDYIDAQEGGPGKGWFRIVKSPAEARVVINDGKLAVIPGVEFANIFNCKLVFNPDGSETSGCDKAEIDRQIDELYKLGVRQLYPFHDVNSALGGTGIFSPLTLNVIGFLGTHQFWKTKDCPDVPYLTEGSPYTGFNAYQPGAIMQTAIPATGNDPVTAVLIKAVNGTLGLPLYPADRRQCNARGLTDLGRYALQQIMKKKFIVDIDHASLEIKQDIIDLAKAQSPQYPLNSLHGGHGGIAQAQAKDMLGMGGVIFPYNPDGKQLSDFIAQIKPIRNTESVFGIGVGMDSNGFGGSPGPRGAGSAPLKYPFTLFKGPGWGPQFAGIKPMTVKMLTIPESGKSWHADEVGSAHYGLLPDIVEETRLEGGEAAITALYNSAEAYLQMWEKTVNR